MTEILWIFVNFSADDDPQVLHELLVPNYNILNLINNSLIIFGQGEHFDDVIVRNILWIFGNMIGDKTPQVFTLIANNTDLLNFLMGVINWPIGMPTIIMEILPWLVNSIT